MQIVSKFISLGIAIFFLIGLLACDSDTVGDDMPIPTDKNIWTGATITFEKADDADPSLVENQDQITDNVWITRGNNGGQIFNIKSENNSSKTDSPSGTLWAIGTISDVDNLEFKNFRTAVSKPKDVVGKNLVAFLIDDEVFLSVKFTKWSEQKGGGFAYERSSQ